MRRSALYRVSVAAAVLMIGTGAAMVTSGAAWSAASYRDHARPPSRAIPAGIPAVVPTTAPGGITVGAPGGATPPPVVGHSSHRLNSRPILWFDAIAQIAYLKIPTPACPVGDPNCVWMLFMNEPRDPGHPIVGMVSGTS